MLNDCSYSINVPVILQNNINNVVRTQILSFTILVPSLKARLFPLIHMLSKQILSIGREILFEFK